MEKKYMNLTKEEIGYLAMCVRMQNNKDRKSEKKFIERDGKVVVASALDFRLRIGRSLGKKLLKLKNET